MKFFYVCIIILCCETIDSVISKEEEDDEDEDSENFWRRQFDVTEASCPVVLSASSENGLNFPNIAIVTSTSLSEVVTQSYNIKNDEGYILVPLKNQPSICVKILISVVKVDNSTSHGIHDEIVLKKLKLVDIIIGEYLDSVVTVASPGWLNKPYFITTPLGTNAEDVLDRLVMKNGGDQPSMIYSLWPSPTVFITAVAANVRLLTAHVTSVKKIFVLSYTESEDSVMFISRLEQEVHVQTSGLTYVYDLYNTVALLNRIKDMAGKMREIYQTTTDIRQKIKDHGTNIVILYLDMPLQTKMRILEILFSKGADLDSDDIVWLMADPTFTFERGAMSALYELPLLKLNLYVMDICMWPNIGNLLSVMSYVSAGIPHYDMEASGLLKAKGIIYKLVQDYKGKMDTVLSDHFQTVCPRAYSSSSTRRQFQFGFGKVGGGELMVKCPNVKSLRRVGFPIENLIRILILDYQELERSSISSVFAADMKGVVEFKNSMPHGFLTFTYKDSFLMGISKNKEESTYAVLIEDPPFVVKQTDYSYEGLAIDIYDRVKVELLKEGIHLSLKFRDVDVYGTNDNGTWTGVFGQIKYEDNVVLGIGQISVTDERSADKSFTFSPAFAYTSVTYTTRKAVRYTLLQFLRPFTEHVWIGLCIVFLLSGMYLYLVDVWNPFKDDVEPDNRFTVTETFWHSYLVITQIGAPFGAFVYPARVYSVFYWFFALVVVGCYTGNLASFLSESEMVIVTLEQSGNRLGMLTNSSVSSHYLHKLFGQFEGIHSTEFVTVANYTEGMRRVKEENFIMIGTSLVMRSYRNQDADCNLYVAESSFFDRSIQPLAFPMKSTWKHADSFKRAMGRLQESGELQHLYYRWIDPSAKCASADEDDDTHIRLDWDNFIGLYVLVAVGSVFSYLCLSVKLAYLRMRKKNNRMETDETDGMVDEPLTNSALNTDRETNV